MVKDLDVSQQINHWQIDDLIERLESNKSFLSLEVTPNLSAKISTKLIDNLRQYSQVNAFVCTDSPLARLKPSSILSSIKFQNMLSKPVICTLSMRDRNSIALSGEILAANELGLRAFLSLTGDPIKLGDCKDSKAVFEGHSSLLERIIADLNEGKAINGKILAEPVDRIYNFAVINSYSTNPLSIQNKINKKLKNTYTKALFTQPIYSVDNAKFILEAIDNFNKQSQRNARIILGIFPVTSLKVALFLRDKLPGVFIPEKWIEILEKASKKGRDEEYSEGLKISMELFCELQEFHNAFHLMTNNSAKLTRDCLSHLKQ